VATESSEDDHVTLGLTKPSGFTVANNSNVSPATTVAVFWLIVTDVTAAGVIVIVQESDFVSSATDVAVIVTGVALNSNTAT